MSHVTVSHGVTCDERRVENNLLVFDWRNELLVNDRESRDSTWIVVDPVDYRGILTHPIVRGTTSF